jgi:hypothetical protein
MTTGRQRAVEGSVQRGDEVRDHLDCLADLPSMVISRAFSVSAAPCITIPTPDPAHAGIGSITNGVDSEMGFGLLLGVGADIRVGSQCQPDPVLQWIRDALVRVRLQRRAAWIGRHHRLSRASEIAGWRPDRAAISISRRVILLARSR